MQSLINIVPLLQLKIHLLQIIIRNSKSVYVPSALSDGNALRSRLENVCNYYHDIKQ